MHVAKLRVFCLERICNMGYDNDLLRTPRLQVHRLECFNIRQPQQNPGPHTGAGADTLVHGDDLEMSLTIKF
jgi:hypothetical protein